MSAVFVSSRSLADVPSTVFRSHPTNETTTPHLSSDDDEILEILGKINIPFPCSEPCNESEAADCAKAECPSGESPYCIKVKYALPGGGWGPCTSACGCMGTKTAAPAQDQSAGG
jgi:hypothetical protein